MIHILNCFSKRLPFPPYRSIGAVSLLVETNQGFLLVDTGLGVHDYTQPSRMMRDFMLFMRAVKDPEIAVIRQVVRLGYKPEDIRHIVLTHLHLDHAGGLPDFPHAEVHLYRREYEAWQKPRKFLELAYDQSNFMHGPRWNLHDLSGERWYDFDAIRLKGFLPEIWMIPLPGHTSGHCGVAVQTESGWLLFSGDATPVNLQFDFLSVLLYRSAIGPHVNRLKTFAESHPEVRLVAGHMWSSFFETEKQI